MQSIQEDMDSNEEKPPESEDDKILLIEAWSVKIAKFQHEDVHPHFYRKCMCTLCYHIQNSKFEVHQKSKHYEMKEH